MNIDLTVFNKVNIIDTCSIWNIISCTFFYSRALDHKCHFSITKFVEYECLFKARKNPSSAEQLVQERFRKEFNKGKFQSHGISISDLQDPDIVNLRKKIGMGELSSIAFARKINQCFLTDDQKGRRLASELLGAKRVQTTPHLLGHLIYLRVIIESEVDQLIKDHNDCERPLERFFREVQREALKIRFMTGNQS